MEFAPRKFNVRALTIVISTDPHNQQSNAVRLQETSSDNSPIDTSPPSYFVN